jgi:hypothetical protein
MATLDELVSAAKDVVALLDEYPYWPNDERQVDRILFAYLRGHFGTAKRQWPVRLGANAEGRIDFRLGGNNPLVFELVVRTPQGGNLGVSGNGSELRKLSRVPYAQARVRALLLLDLTENRVNFETLKQKYGEYHLGQGQYERQPVSVVYVARDVQHRFIWSPFKS